MDQDVARRELDGAVVRVGDADNPCFAQLWGCCKSHSGGGLLEQEAVFLRKTNGPTLWSADEQTKCLLLRMKTDNDGTNLYAYSPPRRN